MLLYLVEVGEGVDMKVCLRWTVRGPPNDTRQVTGGGGARGHWVHSAGAEAWSRSCALPLEQLKERERLEPADAGAPGPAFVDSIVSVMKRPS